MLNPSTNNQSSPKRNNDNHKRPVIYLDSQLNQRRQVKLKTCADVYDYWRTCKRLYKKAPKDGVEFQIDYIDTGLVLDPEVRANAPIALTLHGAPGSYHDFSLLIHHLAQQKVRVIAPNFPEYTATVKTKVLFRHSADEKAAYLRDFLKAINVNKIDLLVSHSSAIFPTLLILLNANKINNNNARMLEQTNIAETDLSKGIGPLKQDESNERRRSTMREATQQKQNQLTQPVTQVVAHHDTDLDPTPGSSSSSCYSECNVSRASTPETRFIADLDSGSNVTPSPPGLDKQQDAINKIDGNNNDTHHEIDHNEVTVESRLGERLQKDQEKRKGEEEENSQQQYQLGQQQLNSTTDIRPQTKYRRDRKGNEIKSSSKGQAKGKRSQDVIVQFEQPIEIKAVALFNPAGHRLPKSMKPTWFKCGSVRVYQHKLGRSLFRKLGPAFLTIIGVPVRVDNMDNVMLSATVMRNSKCHRVVRQLEQLSEMKLPTLLVFSENDKLIEKEIFYEMTEHMNLDKTHFDIFNSDGDLELSQSSWQDWIRVMVFKAGGHYAYSNYAKTVNNAVSELLNKVAKQS